MGIAKEAPDQPTSSNKVLLVGVDFHGPNFDSELEELALLAQSAGLEPVGRHTCKRHAPDASLFVGSGKADELVLLAQQCGASEILFDQAISPAQQRNLERRIGMPVNDRIFLILEIFAQRARSHEGKLQVELAKLQYLSTRLVRRWSHLERQAGGIGGRGGPGETQMELDRRMIGESIKRVKARLDTVKKQRNTQRRQRVNARHFGIALVGYTNAGKSTVFNKLTKAKVYAADQLFATLDPTTRSIYLGDAQQSVSLSDTVGFIRDLPHNLIDAFEATLQEAATAQLLLHVIDCSNPNFSEQIKEVQLVLGEIDALHIPQLLVFNKLDLLPSEQRPQKLRDFYEIDGKSIERVFVSAKSGEGGGEGMEILRTILASRAVPT